LAHRLNFTFDGFLDLSLRQIQRLTFAAQKIDHHERSLLIAVNGGEPDSYKDPTKAIIGSSKMEMIKGARRGNVEKNPKIG